MPALSATIDTRTRRCWRRKTKSLLAIYVWCIYARGPLAAAMTLGLQKVSTPLYRDVDLYSRAATTEGRYALEGTGFRPGVMAPGHFVPDLYLFRRSPVSPDEMPSYDGYMRHNGEDEISDEIARSLEDLMRVMAVRSAVFIGEQRCPYREEFDGNDLSGQRICSAVSGMSPPPLCAFAISRISRSLSGWRCDPEFRGRRLAQQVIQAGIEICRLKGYTRIYGQSERKHGRMVWAIRRSAFPTRRAASFSPMTISSRSSSMSPDTRTRFRSRVIRM